MTNSEILKGLGVDEERMMAVSFATTGVRNPIGFLQLEALSLTHGRFCRFTETEGVETPSDLNVLYTGITPEDYRKDFADMETCSREFLEYLDCAEPHVVVVNSRRWFDRMAKQASGTGFGRVFSRLSAKRVFCLSSYEKARTFSKYTMGSASYGSFSEMLQHMDRMAAQARGAMSMLDIYRLRGIVPLSQGEDDVVPGVPKARTDCGRMTEIWTKIMANTPEQEGEM